MPFLGFNSDRYDINMIKLTENQGGIMVAKKENNYMFLTAEHLKFLDVGKLFSSWIIIGCMVSVYGLRIRKTRVSL